MSVAVKLDGFALGIEIACSDPRKRLRRTGAVTGRDGYVAVLALAEIDPEFEGKRVIVWLTGRMVNRCQWVELRLVA